MKNLIIVPKSCLTIGKTLILCITFRTRKRVYGCFFPPKRYRKTNERGARETRKIYFNKRLGGRGQIPKLVRVSSLVNKFRTSLRSMQINVERHDESAIPFIFH